MPGEKTERAECRDVTERLLPESPWTKSLPFCRQLLLVAAMGGLDAIVVFEHLYEVPLLQILGVPIAFVSLYPIFTGPAAMILVNLLGRVSDRGSEHKKRKIMVVVFLSALMLLGAGLVVVANLVLVSGDGDCGTVTVSPYPACQTHSPGDDRNTTDARFNVSRRLLNFSSSDLLSTEANSTGNDNSTEGSAGIKGSSSPVTVALGIAGFALMEMGYDMSVGSTRACVLACSSPADHTHLLVLALVAAAMGGGVVIVLGLMDLSPILHLSGGGEGSLLSQATVLLLICGGLVVMTSTSTIVSAFFAIVNTDSNPYQSPTEDGKEKAASYHSCGVKERHRSAESRRGEESRDQEPTLSASDLSSPGESDARNAQDKSESSPEANEDFRSRCQRKSKLEELSQADDILNEKGALSASTSSNAERSRKVTRTSDKAEVQSSKRWGWDKHKFNMVIAFLSGFLGYTSLNGYNMYITDFLGKVVKGGDSNAARDSAEFRAYSEGVRLGMSGELVVSCVYMVANLLHNRLLAFWGVKMDFCVTNALLAVTVLSLIVSKHVAAFYVCSVVLSFQRAAIYTVPYIIAIDYVQHQEKSGKQATGTNMAVMACMVPLNLCTVAAACGPLVTLTHYPGAPLVVSVICTGLAAALFLLLRPS